MKFRLLIITTVCFLAGSIIGWFTYKDLVENAYGDLRDEIEKANIFESLFADDPALLHLFYELDSRPGDGQIIRRYRKLRDDVEVLVWRILRTQGIIRGDDGLNKIGVQLTTSLGPILDRDLDELVNCSSPQKLDR
jgi:hypothetical protein